MLPYFYFLLGPFNNVFRASVSLKATLITTSTITSIGFDDSMSEFPRSILTPVVNLSIDHNASTYTSAEC